MKATDKACRCGANTHAYTNHPHCPLNQVNIKSNLFRKFNFI